MLQTNNDNYAPRHFMKKWLDKGLTFYSVTI